MAQYRVGRNRCWKLNQASGTWETIPCSQVPSQRTNVNRGRRRGFRRADGVPDWDTEDVSVQLFDMLEKDGDIQNDKPETNESNADGNYKETKGYDYNNQDIPSFDYADGDFQYMDADCGIMVNADGFLDDLSASGHILRGRKDGHPSKRQYADGFDESSDDVADTDKGDMYAFGTGGGFDADWDSADGRKIKSGTYYVSGRTNGVVNILKRDKNGKPYLHKKLKTNDKVTVSVNKEGIVLADGGYIPKGFWGGLETESERNKRLSTYMQAEEVFKSFPNGKYIVNKVTKFRSSVPNGILTGEMGEDNKFIKSTITKVNNGEIIDVVGRGVFKSNSSSGVSYYLKLDNGKYTYFRPQYLKPKM